MTVSSPTRLQRLLLAACIILAPVSITVYITSWVGDPRKPLEQAAHAGGTGNLLHFVGGVAASFFLPLGYLAMSRLGWPKAPRFAAICAAFSLIGWIPWSALIGLDDLAYQVTLAGGGSSLAALWARTNGDPTMSAYLLIYIVGHLTSAILLAIMLRRLRLIPLWAAWAFALTSPLQIAFFVFHASAAGEWVKYLICALWIVGAIPAAQAMAQGQEA